MRLHHHRHRNLLLRERVTVENLAMHATESAGGWNPVKKQKQMVPEISNRCLVDRYELGEKCLVDKRELSDMFGGLCLNELSETCLVDRPVLWMSVNELSETCLVDKPELSETCLVDTPE